VIGILPVMLSRFTLGDTLSFTTPLADYPASAGWVLTYRLVPRVAGAVVVIICTASGDSHLAAASATTTAAWGAGAYSWASFATLGAVSHTVASGSTTLLPDPRTLTAGTDTRSQAAIALAAAQAALAAWTPTTKRYSINGREMEFNSPADIVAIVRYWQAEVQREDRAAQLLAGRADRRKTYVRLGRA